VADGDRPGPDRQPDGDRRAVVTGGAGFVGSHLVDRLVDDGWAVLVVDDLSTGRAADVRAEAAIERLDVALGDPTRPIGAWRPSVVYHLAAQASAPLSMRDPLRDLAVNLIGTHRVAEAAREAGAARLVFVSSGGAIYGESAQPATETTRPAPSSFYGIHKLAAEGHVALAGVPYAIARPSNIYGPRQRAGLEGAVVATFVELARQGQPLTIDGDGSQTRDLVHVRDVVAALCRLGDGVAEDGIWNVASGHTISVAALADEVETATGHALGRVHGPVRPGDVRHSAVSAARLRGLGWSPSVALSDGIKELLEGDRI
jgi:UDP-glucose 4-epimerase